MHTVTGGSRQHVALTIYNVGSGLVQDRRRFTFEAGENALDFTDVAERIDSTSVNFTSRTDPTGTRVLEQNFAYDLVDTGALLRKYVDQNIEIITEDGALYSGTLLSGRGAEVILRAGDGQIVVVRLDKIRDLRFPSLPGGLLTRPTLRWLLEAPEAGEQEIELNYLTNGLTWTADYVVLLAADNATLDLNGWVTLNNTSGARYENAQVKLVAGDIERLPEPRMDKNIMPQMLRAAAAPAVEQRNFSEYKLYEIARPVTVADNEQKQVQFVSGAHIAAQLIYIVTFSRYVDSTGPEHEPAQRHKVNQRIEFRSLAGSGLDADLPAGRVRVYQRDTDDAALLIGEDQIDHTPKGEKVSLKLGSSFDLVAERTRLDFRTVAKNTFEETHRVEIRNRKADQAVDIRVIERLYHFTDWRVLSSTVEYQKVSADRLEFVVKVPAKGSVSFDYRVRTSW